MINITSQPNKKGHYKAEKVLALKKNYTSRLKSGEMKKSSRLISFIRHKNT